MDAVALERVSGLPGFSRTLVRPEHQPPLSTAWCNRKSGATPRRNGSGSPGVRVSLTTGHRPVAGVSGFAIGGSATARFSQAGSEVGGSGQAVLRGVGQDRQLPGWGVSGARGTQGQSADKAVSAPGVDWGRGPLRGGGGASAPTGVPKRRSWPWRWWRKPRPEDTSRPSGWPAIARCLPRCGRDWRHGNLRLGRAAGYDGLAVTEPIPRASPQTQTAA